MGCPAAQKESELQTHTPDVHITAEICVRKVEILDASLERNTMVCLGTGTGKTFIAVMLINELAHQVHEPYQSDRGRRTVFLVNTGTIFGHLRKTLAV